MPNLGALSTQAIMDILVCEVFMNIGKPWNYISLAQGHDMLPSDYNGLFSWLERLPF